MYNDIVLVQLLLYHSQHQRPTYVQSPEVLFQAKKNGVPHGARMALLFSFHFPFPKLGNSTACQLNGNDCLLCCAFDRLVSSLQVPSHCAVPLVPGTAKAIDTPEQTSVLELADLINFKHILLRQRDAVKLAHPVVEASVLP